MPSSASSLSASGWRSRISEPAESVTLSSQSSVLTDLAAKEALLERIISRHAPLLIAYSGGVDSTLLLAVAHRILDDQVTGIIADSPSLPRASLNEAVRVAKELGIHLELIATTELEDPRYAENPINRCYFCKAELFSRMDQVRESVTSPRSPTARTPMTRRIYDPVPKQPPSSL